MDGWIDGGRKRKRKRENTFHAETSGTNLDLFLPKKNIYIVIPLTNKPINLISDLGTPARIHHLLNLHVHLANIPPYHFLNG